VALQTNIAEVWLFPRKCVIPILCVKIGKGMQSNTIMSIKVYLMAILDNYTGTLLRNVISICGGMLWLEARYHHI